MKDRISLLVEVLNVVFFNENVLVRLEVKVMTVLDFVIVALTGGTLHF